MNALQALQQYWNYSSFRPMQGDIVQQVLNGKNVLALLPTGGGKSLCFQVPTMCRSGMTLVVSPLISLIKDQVERLRRQGIKAYSIHSGLHHREIDLILDNCCSDPEVKFLYVSPERLQSTLFLERVKRMPIALLAVDEAHCISQWGHDFRPAYLQIPSIKTIFPKIQIVALTATATPEVIEDIKLHLELTEVEEFKASFLRTNVSLSCLEPENKERKLMDILQKVPGSAIVYTRSRKSTETISKLLQRNRIRSDFYHAGLAVSERNRRQEAWIKGEIRVIVATNAFGMGIDKPDVRVVVHTDLPDNPEAYFQEAGRAGRDGQKAYAVILSGQHDQEEIAAKFKQKYPSPELIRRVYQALANYYKIAVGSSMLASYDFDEDEILKLYKLPKAETYYAIRRLEQEGYIQLNDGIEQSSRIWVHVDAIQLYDFQLTHPKLDGFIKTLLRMYGGELYSGFVSLKEPVLARAAGLSQDECISRLELLHQNGILMFEPRKFKPQLVFTLPRQDASRLALSVERVGILQKSDEQRALRMVQYTKLTQGCRNQFLLSYFGESLEKPCGICDLCVQEKKRKSINLDSMKVEIIELLSKENLYPQNILESLKLRYPEEALTLEIRSLLDNAQIRYLEDGKLTIAL